MKSRASINESQRITGHMRHLDNLTPHRRLGGAVHNLSGEAIHAGVVVRQGGADPSLNVTHHQLVVGPLNTAQLGHGVPESVDRLTQLLHTIPHGGRLPRRDGAAVGEPDHVCGGGAGGVEAYGQGGMGEEHRALLDGGCLGREGGVAELGVRGGGAGCSDELGVGGPNTGSGCPTRMNEYC